MTKQGFQWSSEELLGKHFQAVFRSLDHESLAVKVNAALALTEMIVAYESGTFQRVVESQKLFVDGQSLVRKAVGLQVGKVVQGTGNHTTFVAFSKNGYRSAQDVR